MKLKDFEIMYIFSCMTIYDKNGNKLADIYNDFETGSEIGNYVRMTNDKRTELEKWNTYKNYNIVKIKNADMDCNWENNYVDIVIDY